MAAKSFGGWAVGILIGLTFAAPFASGAEPDAAGRPEGMQAGQVVRYYLWRDTNDVWHLRTTTKMQNHRFTGTIKIVGGGRIRDLTAVKVEGQGPLQDQWKLNPAKDTITWDLSTKGQMDGFDFQLAPRVKELQFTLKVDGQEKAERIFIGRGAANPSSAQFVLPAK